MPRKTIEERFWEKVDKRGPDECWNWAGATNTRYGIINEGGGTGRMLLAHRVSFALHIGPAGALHVCHTCDNTKCVNPAHLFLGTHRDNMQDCVAKGRHRSSKKTHCHKGHPYDERNTIRLKPTRNGSARRNCRACENERDRQYRREKKIARLLG